MLRDEGHPGKPPPPIKLQATESLAKIISSDHCNCGTCNVSSCTVHVSYKTLQWPVSRSFCWLLFGVCFRVVWLCHSNLVVGGPLRSKIMWTSEVKITLKCICSGPLPSGREPTLLRTYFPRLTANCNGATAAISMFLQVVVHTLDNVLATAHPKSRNETVIKQLMEDVVEPLIQQAEGKLHKKVGQKLPPPPPLSSPTLLPKGADFPCGSRSGTVHTQSAYSTTPPIRVLG